MKVALRLQGVFILAAMVTGYAPVPLRAQPSEGCNRQVSAAISVDEGHPWRPPFGLDRVGRPPTVQVALAMAENFPVREYSLVGYRRGEEIERHSITTILTDDPPTYTVPFSAPPEKVTLLARCRLEAPLQEIARAELAWPAFEADAVARSDRRVNPVNLGTVLVPHDWLLLAGGQAAVIEVAAISRDRDLPDAHVRASFAGGAPVEVAWPLEANHRAVKELKVPLTAKGDRSVLHVSLTDGTRELWRKEIRTMIVAQPPRWPAFGAVETKLRYDAPISVKDPKTGAFSSIDYDRAWDPQLNDVVVFLPNGARFVFWRGASYVPFWAGRFNTGFNYQWAETMRQDAVDYIEPLMDRELRYGRVRIVESTPSKVHVRWTYTLSDFEYQVWGEQATEDFYFYPDGFGTRVLTLTSPLNNESYQISEFIVLVPQSAYPLEVLPEIPIDLLTLDGGKRRFVLPQDAPTTSSLAGKLTAVQHATLYRVSLHKNDPATAIYFSPHDTGLDLYAFTPFYDRDQLVTPAYWGKHWPLGRGSMTGAGISDRIDRNPSHVSIAGWVRTDDQGKYENPPPERPLFSSTGHTVDALGRTRIMNTRRWVWLIAHTDAPDEVLLEWAHSYSEPPSLQVRGARIDLPSYSPERRALRLVAESSSIEIHLEPVVRTVNPVFEIDQAPKELASATIDGKALPTEAYAWDGATLWMKTSIGARGANIGLRFR